MSQLVSVIMPAFNCGEYIEEAIQSILVQSYSNFELLIWDDGSTDHTVDVIGRFQDQRISLYRNASNEGYVAVMNALFSVARGEFVIIQDGDDRAHVNRIDELLNVLVQNPCADLAGSHLVKFYQDGRRISVYSNLSVNDLNRSFKTYVRPGITFGTLLMRRYVTEIPFRNLRFVSRAQDIDWLFRVSEKHRFINCDAFLYEYRQHNQSMSNVRQRDNVNNLFFWEYICFITQARREEGADVLQPVYSKRLLDFLNAVIDQKRSADPVFRERHLAYGAKRNGLRWEAFLYALKGLGKHPFQVGSYQCFYKILFHDL